MNEPRASSRIAVFRRQVELRSVCCAAGVVLLLLVAWLEARFDGRTEILAATAVLLWLGAVCTQTLVLARLAGGAGLRFWRNVLFIVVVLLLTLLAMEAAFWRIHYDILLESYNLAAKQSSMVALGISGVALGVLLIGLVLGFRGFNPRVDAAVAKLALVMSVLLLLFAVCESAFHLTGNFGFNGWEVFDSLPSREPGASYLFRGTFGVRNEFVTEVRYNRLGFRDVDR